MIKLLPRPKFVLSVLQKNRANIDSPVLAEANTSSLIAYKKYIYFGLITVIIVVICALAINKVNKDKQLSEKKQFIGLLSANLIASDQSLDEVVQSLNIVNSNYDKAASEGTLQSDYALIISDNQKSLSQIESIKTNSQQQKESISQVKTPDEYETLKIDFMDYYSQTDRLLDSLINDFIFENNLLKVISTNDSSPINNDLWKKQNREEIIILYKDLKNQTVTALSELSKIKVSDKYQNYHDMQSAYFQLILAASDEIVNILSETEAVPPGQDDPTQIEKAYQVAFKSQEKITSLSEQIIDEKQRILSLKIGRQDFDNLISLQRSVEEKIKGINQKLYQESQNNSKQIF